MNAPGIDRAECLRRGAVGALGAIPGTLAAHPFDIVKMRQQVTGAPLRTAIGSVSEGGASRFYRGVGAGVAQKVLTRGPMFLASEVSTQAVQVLTGLSREYAIFVGSACSGYITGFCAAPAEWTKVQPWHHRILCWRQPEPLMIIYQPLTIRHVSLVTPSSQVQRGASGSSAGVNAVLGARSRLARLHGAGTRNAVFDATFFATENMAQKSGLPPAMSYAMGAALAVVLDFPLDAAVKRSMAAGLDDVTAGGMSDGAWRATARLLVERRLTVFNGLCAKVAEFAISYAVTGQCAAVLTQLCSPRSASRN